MPSTEIVRFVELKESKWKNGGGITRKIASAFIDNNCLWRLSMADVTGDGPFSEFAEYERILTVVNGHGMTLQSEAESIDASPWVPVQFSGALKIFGSLKSGPLTNLNLMFNPDHCTADVTAISGPCRSSMTFDERHILVVHSLAGAVKINDGAPLLPGDTAIIGSDAGRLELEHEDAALWIKIDLNAQTSPGSLVFSLR